MTQMDYELVATGPPGPPGPRGAPGPGSHPGSGEKAQKKGRHKACVGVGVACEDWEGR